MAKLNRRQNRAMNGEVANLLKLKELTLSLKLVVNLLKALHVPGDRICIQCTNMYTNCLTFVKKKFIVISLILKHLLCRQSNKTLMQ